MNKKIILYVTCAALLFCNLASLSAEEEKPVEFSISVGAAYYPESSHTTSSGTSFQGLSGAYDSAELAVTPALSYTMPFLTSDNMLMENNYLILEAALQISPVSLTPSASVTISPIAFLELSAGGKTGTGWNLAGIQGMGEYSISKKEYEDISAFSHWYLYGYGSATLMFDFGEVWEGDWHHIVMTATYEAGYQKLTGTSDVWQWQANSYPMANGWIYTQDYFVGYKMPLKVSLVGLDLTLSGHYDTSDFDASNISKSYEGDFMTISISPLAQIQLDSSGKNELFVYGCISSRRSFKEEWEDYDTEPLLTKNGREFYFDSFGIQWKHRF